MKNSNEYSNNNFTLNKFKLNEFDNHFNFLFKNKAISIEYVGLFFQDLKEEFFNDFEILLSKSLLQNKSIYIMKTYTSNLKYNIFQNFNELYLTKTEQIIIDKINERNFYLNNKNINNFNSIGHLMRSLQIQNSNNIINKFDCNNVNILSNKNYANNAINIKNKNILSNDINNKNSSSKSIEIKNANSDSTTNLSIDNNNLNSDYLNNDIKDISYQQSISSQSSNNMLKNNILLLSNNKNISSNHNNKYVINKQIDNNNYNNNSYKKYSTNNDENCSCENTNSIRESKLLSLPPYIERIKENKFFNISDPSLNINFFERGVVYKSKKKEKIKNKTPFLKKFHPKFMKKENIDKKILRKFRKFVRNYVNKNEIFYNNLADEMFISKVKNYNSTILNTNNNDDIINNNNKSNKKTYKLKKIKLKTIASYLNIKINYILNKNQIKLFNNKNNKLNNKEFLEIKLNDTTSNNSYTNNPILNNEKAKYSSYKFNNLINNKNLNLLTKYNFLDKESKFVLVFAYENVLPPFSSLISNKIVEFKSFNCDFLVWLFSNKKIHDLYQLFVDEYCDQLTNDLINTYNLKEKDPVICGKLPVYIKNLHTFYHLKENEAELYNYIVQDSIEEDNNIESNIEKILECNIDNIEADKDLNSSCKNNVKKDLSYINNLNKTNEVSVKSKKVKSNNSIKKRLNKKRTIIKNNHNVISNVDEINNKDYIKNKSNVFKVLSDNTANIDNNINKFGYSKYINNLYEDTIVNEQIESNLNNVNSIDYSESNLFLDKNFLYDEYSKSFYADVVSSNTNSNTFNNNFINKVNIQGNKLNYAEDNKLKNDSLNNIETNNLDIIKKESRTSIDNLYDFKKYLNPIVKNNTFFNNKNNYDYYININKSPIINLKSTSSSDIKDDFILTNTLYL